MLWRYLQPNIKETWDLSFRCSGAHLFWMSQVDKNNRIPPFISVIFLLFTSLSYLIKVKNNVMFYKHKCLQRRTISRNVSFSCLQFTQGFCPHHGIRVGPASFLSDTDLFPRTGLRSQVTGNTQPVRRFGEERHLTIPS